MADKKKSHLEKNNMLWKAMILILYILVLKSTVKGTLSNEPYLNMLLLLLQIYKHHSYPDRAMEKMGII